jgi:hypothetical protein
VEPVAGTLASLDVTVEREPADGDRYLGLVFDATGITDVPGLTRSRSSSLP